MQMSPYVERLRADLLAAAAPAGPEVAKAAKLLVDALDPAVQLCLLEAQGDAAVELSDASPELAVEVRLRGREPVLVGAVASSRGAPAFPVPPAAGSPEAAGPAGRLSGGAGTGGDGLGSDVGPSDARLDDASASGQAPDPDDGLARVTLRLPESLKNRAEQGAARAGLSLNAWLVRAVARSVDAAAPNGTGFAAPFPPSTARRVTGWATG